MPRDGSPVHLRAYRPGEDAATTHTAFREAVLQTAAADYDAEALAAWAGPEHPDLTRWDARRAAAHTVVAEVDGQVAGFADFCDDGLLDMLFVRPAFGRRGVARALVTKVQDQAARAGLRALRTRASRTARPAFARFGFRLVAERPDNVVNGYRVPNVEMTCDLPRD